MVHARDVLRWIRQAPDIIYIYVNHTGVPFFFLTVFLVEMDMVCIEHQGRITEKGDRSRRVSECKVDCTWNILDLCVDNGYMSSQWSAKIITSVKFLGSP